MSEIVDIVIGDSIRQGDRGPFATTDWASKLRCRVYWGSHGCHLERGHAGHHLCDCCTCTPHYPLSDPRNDGCVGAFPFYGPDTHFYGEDS